MKNDLPAGIMPNYRQQIPPELLACRGKWVRHEMVRPGVIRHLAGDGTAILTVRILLPPNGLLSAATLRQLARWIRVYALTGRRTSRQGFEFVGVRPELLDNFLAELAASGFPAGGTGNSLHQIKCCTSFIHCQNAAVDAPSIAKTLADYLYPAFFHQDLPAPLKISVSGCPNQCGGGVEADIGISGYFATVPRVDDAGLMAANIDFGHLISGCPVGAIRPRQVEGGTTVVINAERCIRCTSCIQVAPEGIKPGPERFVAIAVGGHGGNNRRGPEMAAVVFSRVPARPLDYAAICERVQRIIACWRDRGKRGERLAGFLERLGWPAFLKAVGASPVADIFDNHFPFAGLRRDLHLR
ncbi:Sulfite reductase, dissimilatory-type subunit beta [Moorella thermoacetica]|uniref:hypothetical protein n=1 Tax=Neomoorella thermoacetica TaxID=1525 RepID=UPI0030CEE3D4